MPTSYGNRVLGELALGAPDVADLRDRVDPERQERRRGVRLEAERVARGEPALLGRGRGQARKADQVADGVDVRHRGAEVLVDRNPPALVGIEADRLEVEAGGRALPAGGVEDDIGRDPLAARERRERPALRCLHPDHALAEAEDRRSGRAGGSAATRRSRGRRSRAGRGRASTIVTLAPSAANIDANSTPITPAPTITIVLGSFLQPQHDVVAVEHRRPVEVDLGRVRRRGAGSRAR